MRDALVNALASRGIPVIEPARCMLERLTAAELFIAGGSHYTAIGNAALAECLRPFIAAALDSVHAKSNGTRRSGT